MKNATRSKYFDRILGAPWRVGCGPFHHVAFAAGMGAHSPAEASVPSDLCFSDRYMKPGVSDGGGQAAAGGELR